MTTTQALREYLDAYGIDGPPTETGWYAVRFIGGEVGVVFCDGRGFWHGSGARVDSWVAAVDGKMAEVFGERTGRCGSFFASDLVRHAPLNIAPPAGRDLDAEVVRGVQAGRSA